MSNPYIKAVDVTYHFKFSPKNPISSNGKIEITIPNNFNGVDGAFSSAVCTGLIPKVAANGLKVEYSAYKLTISEFNEYRPGSIIILSCSKMKNPNTLPPSPRRTGTFKIEIYYDKTLTKVESNTDILGVMLKYNLAA